MLITLYLLLLAATIGFEHTQYVADEGIPTLQLCLRVLSSELERPVNLSVSTAGDAQVSIDYTIPRNTTIYPDDNGRKCLDVSIIDDLIVEDSEMIVLTLTSLDSAIFLHPDSVTVVINDNDRILVAMQQPSYTVSEGDGELHVAIEIVDGTLDKSVFVLVQSRDGSATAHTGDYTSLSDTLIFPPGSTVGSMQHLMVEVGDDLVVEGMESFTVYVTSTDSSLAIRAGNEDATIFIVDNDISKFVEDRK